MALVFTYTKTPVSIDRLSQEIRSSSITVSLDFINLFGANLDIFFKADLPEADVLVLDQLVLDHTGEPMPSEEAKSIAMAQQYSYYDPSPESLEIGKASIAVDASRKLLVRGQLYTDEGSFRDSFPGSSLFQTLDGIFSFSSASDEVVGDADTDLTVLRSLYPYMKLSTDSDECFTQGSVRTDKHFSLEETYKGSDGSGAAVVSNWFPMSAGDGSISVSSSRVFLNSGTFDGSSAGIFKQIDYLPVRLQVHGKISQRVAGQTAIAGLASSDKSIQALVVFEGTNNRTVTFKTRANSDDFQATTCTLPFGKTTAIDHTYTIEVVNGSASLLINDQLVATHKDHIPDAYDTLGIWLQIENTETVNASTQFSSHWVSFQNVDQVDILNSFSTVPVKVKLTSPAALDGKPMVSTTPRPVGKYTYLSAAGDDSSDPTSIDNGTPVALDHHIGDAATWTAYFDINAVDNETHIHTAVLQWKGASFDKAKCEICPKTTTITDATNSDYVVVNGILVATTPGTGNKSVDWDNVALVEMVENEFGIKPAGYWDAAFNRTTKEFESITFNPAGTGQYNIFAEEVKFQAFVPSFIMIGDGLYEVKSNDESRLGHNMRVKIIATTVGTDHDWKFCVALYLFRKKTC